MKIKIKKLLAFAKEFLIPVLLFCFSFYFRFEYIQTYAIAGDESFSAYVAQFSVTDIIHFLLQGNNPPLYEVFLHFWIKLFGIDQISLRIPSVIFSSLVPVAVYFLGKKINLFIAISAALLTLLSNVNIFFGQEGRVYSFLELLSVLAIYFLYSFFETKRTKFLYLLTITNIFLLYAHYLSGFIILVQIAGALLFLRQNMWEKGLFIKLFLSFLVSFIAFLPLLFNFIDLAGNYGTWLAPPDNWKDYWRVIQLFLNNQVVLFYIFFILLGIVLLQVVDLKGEISLWFWLVLGASFLAYTLNYVVSFKYPVWGEKYTLWSTPFFFLLFAYLVNMMFSSLHLRVVAMMFIVYLINKNFDNKISNGRHLDEWVNAYSLEKGKVDAAYIVPYYLNISFAYHYDKSIFKSVSSNLKTIKNYDSVVNLLLKKENIYPIHELYEIDTSNKRIIFMGNFSDFKDEGKQQLDYLSTIYSIDTTYSFWEKMRIYVMSKK